MQSNGVFKMLEVKIKKLHKDAVIPSYLEFVWAIGDLMLYVGIVEKLKISQIVERKVTRFVQVNVCLSDI